MVFVLPTRRAAAEEIITWPRWLGMQLTGRHLRAARVVIVLIVAGAALYLRNRP